jgi:hypothetical protein
MSIWLPVLGLAILALGGILGACTGAAHARGQLTREWLAAQYRAARMRQDRSDEKGGAP